MHGVSASGCPSNLADYSCPLQEKRFQPGTDPAAPVSEPGFLSTAPISPVASSITDDASEVHTALAQAQKEAEAAHLDNDELSRQKTELENKIAELVSIRLRSENAWR